MVSSLKQWRSVILLVGALGLLLALLIPYISQYSLSFQPPPPELHPSNYTFSTPICSSLSLLLPALVFSPEHPTYAKSQYSYFTTQSSEISPACIVKPHSAEEASLAIKALKQEFDAQVAVGPPKQRFAIRSGGHSYGEGATSHHSGATFSNVQGGVVIDMHLINEVTVAEDRNYVVIGTGARWEHVYGKLDGMGLGVAGGRASDVGVGGLLTGGGISFLSPRVGFASGNILGYEIILADGSIARASQNQNPDLWRALQGGSNNFGLVTRFTVRSWPLGKLWGGHTYYTSGKSPELLSAFHEFVKPQNFEPLAAGPILGFGYTKVLGFGVTAAVCNTIYTIPEKWPACFDAFKNIGRLWSSTKVRSHTDATRQVNRMVVPRKRRHQAVTTFYNSHSILTEAYDIFNSLIPAVEHVKGVEFAISIQPVPPLIPFNDNSDPFNLASINDTLVIALISPRWDYAEDDEAMEAASDKWVADLEQAARDAGVYHPFKYSNYAASKQDIVGGYGEGKKEFLQSVSKKLDPDGFWQRACLGGFKLGLEYK